MKDIIQYSLIMSVCTIAASVSAQEIYFFSPVGSAMHHYADQLPQTVGHCVDSLVTDTLYIENMDSGKMDMVVQLYPLARYEYFLDGSLYRRIDIHQQILKRDTIVFDNWETGEREFSYTEPAIDIPNGAYHEFFPNGNIRIMGTLDGYNADGTLKKTGEWKEWDANGKVIRRETYP